MKRWSVLVAIATLICLNGITYAADKADVTGTWKWSFTTPNGQEIQSTAKLKQDGEKVTGTVTGRQGRESEIKEGKLKDGKLSFKVVRMVQDREVTTTYNGTVEGDKIKGKIESTNRDGQPQSRDWEAKRQKEDKA